MKVAKGIEEKNMKSFDGAQINYLINRKKQNPYYVFLHGAGSNYTIWKGYMDALSHRSFLALNLRGHGKSSKSKIQLKNFVKDLAAILSKEKIKEVVLFGNCLSAAIAAEFNRTYPKMVKKMVLFSPFTKRYIRFYSLLYPLNKLAQAVWHFFDPKKRLKFQNYWKERHRPFLYYPIMDARGTHYTMLLDSLGELFKCDLDIRKLDKPALIYLGEGDIFLKNKLFIRDSRDNDNVTIKFLEEGHLTAIKQADSVLDDAKEFLAR